MMERRKMPLVTMMSLLGMMMLLQMTIGQAAASNTIPTRTPAPSQATIELEARSGPYIVALDWDLTGYPNGVLTSYTLFKDDGSTGYTSIYSGIDSQYNDNTNLQMGHNYCYQVKGYDAAGTEIIASNIDCVTFGKLGLTVPHVIVQENAVNVPIPVQVVNATNTCINAADFLVSYDTNVVEAVGVTATSYTQNYAFEANLTNPGQVKISAVTGQNQCASFLQGAGELFQILFDAKGVQGQSSSLNFITGLTATVVYANGDLFNEVDLDLTDGSAEIGVAHQRGDISGNGIINSADSQLASNIAVGSMTPPPTLRQIYACDVNGDRQCTEADSTVLLCYAAFQSWTSCGLQSRHLSSGISTPADIALDVIDSGTVNVNVSAENWAGGAFTLVYDPATLQIDAATFADGFGDGFTLATNDSELGLLRVAMATANPVTTNATPTIQLQVSALQDNAVIGFTRANFNDATGLDFATNLQRDVQLGDSVSIPRVPTAVTLSHGTAQLTSGTWVVSLILLMGLVSVGMWQRGRRI